MKRLMIVMVALFSVAGVHAGDREQGHHHNHQSFHRFFPPFGWCHERPVLRCRKKNSDSPAAIPVHATVAGFGCRGDIKECEDPATRERHPPPAGCMVVMPPISRPSVRNLPEMAGDLLG